MPNTKNAPIKKDKAKKVIEYTTVASAILGTAIYLWKSYKEIISLLS